jgi:hypothetical protein
MTINEIRENGVGVVEEPTIVTIKTCRKKWETESGWYQQVAITDDTGDMEAVFFLGEKYIPMQRNAFVLVPTSILDQSDGNVILKVREWAYYNTTSEPPMTQEESWLNAQNIQVRGKIKCLYIARLLGRETPKPIATIEKIGIVLRAAKSPEMKELIDETMKG